MRILVTGAGGLLGREVARLAEAAGHVALRSVRDDLDVTDAPRVRTTLNDVLPDAVVHCAAYTAVDRAESEAEAARAVNRDGARNVAVASAEVGARLTYVSTDYVFDGRKRAPYLPDDATGPLSVYGRTKLDGEEATIEGAPGALIVRTSWLYGSSGGFVPSVLGRAEAGEALRVVDDQRGRPTWAPHAARAILELTEAGVSGVHHVANNGDCTWRELAEAALELAGLDAPLEGVSSAGYGAAAPRPAYSVLDTNATERSLGWRLPHWRDALETLVESRQRPAGGRPVRGRA